MLRKKLITSNKLENWVNSIQNISVKEGYMKLIYDIDSKADVHVSTVLNENTGQEQKQYKIKGTFSTIGTKNRNGRIYPRNIWETEVLKYQDVIKSGSKNALMEWEHPPRTDVDMMEAIQKITELKIEGDFVIGEAVLLDNERANQIKTLIDNGIKISVSSRGVGSVKNGIVENFKLVTYDLVSDPSDYNQTMNGVLESYSLNEGILTDKNFELDQSGNIVEVHGSTNTAPISEPIQESEDSKDLDEININESIKQLNESDKALLVKQVSDMISNILK